MKSKGDFLQAIKSFYNCCENLDAGFHGCYGAGRLSEKIGDPMKAIDYYRMSKSREVLKIADDLEILINR